MKCKICATDDNHSLFESREMMFGTREKFTYFQCRACKCLQITDVPSDMHKYYPQGYYSFNAEKQINKKNRFYDLLIKQRCRTAIFGKGVKINRLLKPFVKLPYNVLNKYMPIIKRARIGSFDDGILDVGCGNSSEWLADFQKLGFRNLLGVDPYIDYETKYRNIPILKKSVTELDGSYAFIMFHHSFEHIADPLTTLTAVKRLLKPGGVCLLRIPIVSSYAWEKYGVNWVELDAPRHFFLHSAKSITLLCGAYGLELFDVVYDSTAFEFAGSEQYQKDIPLFAENSFLVNPEKCIFTQEQMAQFAREAERVNREGCGGRAGFYFVNNGAV